MDRLKNMYELQRQLMNQYINIGKLPIYPFDITEKGNQKKIKGYIYNMLEELAETLEEVHIASETYKRDDLQKVAPVYLETARIIVK